MECRERGWFATPVRGKGWQPCGPEAAGATEDLNRWTRFTRSSVDDLSPRRPTPANGPCVVAAIEGDVGRGGSVDRKGVSRELHRMLPLSGV